MKVKLSKVMGFLFAAVCVWVVVYLWTVRLASSDANSFSNFHEEVIWKLTNVARESSSIVSLLHSQQARIEQISQQLRLHQHSDSQELLAEARQDCYSCGRVPPEQISDLDYASYLFSSQLDMVPLRRVGLGLAGYKLVLGIPTVNRGESYLLRTLRSLLSPQELAKERKALFIIFVAEIDNSTYCQAIIDEMQQHHSTELKEGVLEVVCPNPKSYPPLGHLPQSLSDHPDRVKWRTKQVVDFSLLISYAAQKGDYYIQLEDDVVASKGYIQHILCYVDSRPDNWTLIQFSTLGFIGKLFKIADLRALTEYFLLFYSRQPVDWLLGSFMRNVICIYHQNDEECLAAIDAVSPVFTPSLFQHIGTKSSLRGKTQVLLDGFYNRAISTIVSHNPPALLSCSLPIEKSHISSMVYSGQGVMWANKVQKDDFLLISLFYPQPLVSIHVVTGGKKSQSDVLTSGQVEYSSGANDTNEYFNVLCPFVDGRADCDFPSFTEISKVRIRVTQAQNEWLLISEITIKPLY